MLTSDSLVQASLNTPLSLIHLLYSGMGSVAPPPLYPHDAYRHQSSGCYGIIHLLKTYLSPNQCQTQERQSSARTVCCEQRNQIKKWSGASLVAQWLGIRLPVQGTRVRALVREDPTCCRATKPVRHNY